MTTKLLVDPSGLSQEQLDLIQQFEADYNAVDHFLRKSLGREKQVPLSLLLTEYSSKHIGWRDTETLRTIAEVRNAIVHGKTEPYRYVAVPTPWTVQKLKTCKERLTNPGCAISKFERKVETVSMNDTLAQVLKTITQREYSQFPVYDGNQFLGLLTENGITRWLAQHVSTELSLVELDEVRVSQVLQNEEKRVNYYFVARDMRLDDVRGLFASHELLEAVLITANGKESEKLLGIATRWDIIHLA